MCSLLDVESTGQQPEAFVRGQGPIIATFDHRTQDSGNVSWIVDTEDGELFVKTAGVLGDPPPGAPTPALDHGGRVKLLRNAVDLARSCDHPALSQLRNVVESPLGPMLVYARAPGELINAVRMNRDDPTTAYQRFAHLSADRMITVFDELISAHEALAAEEWVACDLYDGCLIVDLATDRLTLVDLDTYHRGPFVNTMGRMFGSTRFMAPEEFQLGAAIDERTTVFTLGRLVWHFGTRLTERPNEFCGGQTLSDVVQQACLDERDARYPSVALFAAAWKKARSSA